MTATYDFAKYGNSELEEFSDPENSFFIALSFYRWTVGKWPEFNGCGSVCKRGSL